MQHYGMTPTTNNLGEAHENGDVEQSHYRFQQAVDQALRVRGSRDFADRASYERFLQALVRYRNQTREKVARLTGVPVKGITVVAYMLSGLCAGLTGTLLLGYTGIAVSTMGDAYQLPAIAAVVLGGASILGGKGNVIGTALGAFLFTVVISLLTVVHIGEADRLMLQGAILLGVVVLYNLQSFARH